MSWCEECKFLINWFSPRPPQSLFLSLPSVAPLDTAYSSSCVRSHRQKLLIYFTLAFYMLSFLLHVRLCLKIYYLRAFAQKRRKGERAWCARIRQKGKNGKGKPIDWGPMPPLHRSACTQPRYWWCLFSCRQRNFNDFNFSREFPHLNNGFQPFFF